MGKRLFQEIYASVDRTDALALPELIVVSEEDDAETASVTYHAVHKSYFSKEKPVCPYCREQHTTETKIRSRKFKDILPSENGERNVIDLIFHQRYFRCNDCNRVFRENIDFAEESCRYTNRLSDLLAEGTLTQTYEKVCKEYGVPASKTSVGIIMRRRLRMKTELLPSLATPDAMTIFVVPYFSAFYPVVLGIYGDRVRLLDVLSMFDKELHNEYIFCSYLAKLLPGDPTIEFNLDNRVKLEYYQLAKTFEGAIELEDQSGSWAPTNPKKAGAKKEKLSPLEEIIQRINEEFMGEFTDADRVIVNDLYERMKKDEDVQKAAQTDDKQVYHRSVFPGIFDETAMAAYMENQEAYMQLFQDAKKYHAVQAALADMLYRDLHDKKN